MLAKAYTRYLRLSPRKVRLVVDLIKGKHLEEVMAILENVNKGCRFPLKKTISSAFANLNSLRTDKLLAKDVVISSLRVEAGPMLHRFRAATMGRATPVKHRTAHIYVELDRASGTQGTETATKAAAAEVEKKTDKATTKVRRSASVTAGKPKKTVKTAKSGSK
jgi:large subunit ribosomal protein L22